MALAPNGRLALSCGGMRQPKEAGKIGTNDCFVRAWDVDTGLPLEPFGTHFQLTDAVHEALLKTVGPTDRPSLEAALGKLRS